MITALASFLVFKDSTNLGLPSKVARTSEGMSRTAYYR